MDLQKLVVTFGDNPLEFTILDTPVARLWLERMHLRHQWPMDDSRRFYGFNTPEREADMAWHMIQQCIQRINAHAPIIELEFTSVHDQDMLNYLHNIFERYHGALDQQHHDFWLSAPMQVREALAQLNVAVHRCECLDRREPRVVCTWWGMPKTQRLDLDLQARHGQLGSDFGGVYLNYAEIGKTALDMVRDDDHYMAADMFRPFDHFSADFCINFFDQSLGEAEADIAKIQEFFLEHRGFFDRLGINHARDVRMMPLRYKVAQLMFDTQDRSAILDMLRNNQMVTQVKIS
jgi:hypothetical protein